MSLLRDDATAIFTAAVSAVAPDRLVARALRRAGDTLSLVESGEVFPLRHNVKVFGFGKAVTGMVAAVDALLHEHIVGGVASIPVGMVEMLTKNHPRFLPAPACKVRLCEGADGNMPDSAASHTAAEILAGVKAATVDDLVIILVSGGGSALLPLPADTITLADKHTTTVELAKRGATIDELNCVRKHISAVKGGKLAAAAYPATVIALILSDVVGDPLETIASGPTVADTTSVSDAFAVVTRLEAVDALPPSVLTRLRLGASGGVVATHAPFASADTWLHNKLVGTNRIALSGAEAAAVSLGYTVHRQDVPLEGNARDAARHFVALLRDLRDKPGKHCVLAGGETTCVVRGTGKGGRNQELALQAGMLMADLPGTLLLSGGTDGQDGPTDAAGGFADATLLAQCEAAGVDPDAYLADNDSYHALGKLDRLLKTGLTGTNVMDVVVGLVNSPHHR
jgi:glycerate 2-kinase